MVGVDDLFPVFSPISRQAAYQNLRKANWELPTANATDGNERKLSANAINDLTPDWEPLMR